MTFGDFLEIAVVAWALLGGYRAIHKKERKKERERKRERDKFCI
jgi:hypothetical protein